MALSSRGVSLTSLNNSVTHEDLENLDACLPAGREDTSCLSVCVEVGCLVKLGEKLIFF